MRDAIVEYVPWLLSAITITTSFLAGSFHRWTWALALVGQVFWSVWVVVSANWGLLPLNIALWFIYIRNHRRWARARRAQVLGAAD